MSRRRKGTRLLMKENLDRYSSALWQAVRLTGGKLQVIVITDSAEDARAAAARHGGLVIFRSVRIAQQGSF
jgi:hypothetical protein